MHERETIENELKERAEEIQSNLDGDPPIVIIAAGAEDGPDRTMTASVGLNRLRDLNGVLETAQAIENMKHLSN